MQDNNRDKLKSLLDSTPKPFRIFAFSGHGVTVIGRPTRYPFDETPYVVWDGSFSRPYQPTDWHDCMVMYDMYLVSLQRTRIYCFVNGIEPILIFPCKIGESSIEINTSKVAGKKHINGLATYCRMEVLTKGMTVRDFITQSNLLSNKMGFDQAGEVLCRKELLDENLMEPEYDLKPIFVFMVDMCRTYGKVEDYKVKYDLLSP